ncbi:unnamed protein product [Zymoseptoria tritici ST99CH_1A5]|uniref:Uncharacterized protein n=1 Tax=Zymoseptoria tritici ST99CH_1A5 TaxID=1276529 RepID=A0A1Y6M3V9_ZYMTR|nr:unnamed protein product [Zymoseptoria tritici ST99CH_1A5]
MGRKERGGGSVATIEEVEVLAMEVGQRWAVKNINLAEGENSEEEEEEEEEEEQEAAIREAAIKQNAESLALLEQASEHDALPRLRNLDEDLLTDAVQDLAEDQYQAARITKEHRDQTTPATSPSSLHR